MKQKINITLDSDLVRMIDELAAESNRSRSNYIETVLNEHLEKEESGED